MTHLERKRIGLALSGGISRGPAHIGVLNVLAQQSIPIDCVTGVSAGSIVGAVFCAGVPLEIINELGLQIGWRRVARLVWPRRGFLSFKKLERFMINLIGDVEFIGASSSPGVPEAVTEQQTLSVLRVFEIARKLELLRIFRRQRVEMLLGDALETRAVALPLRARDRHGQKDVPYEQARRQHECPAAAYALRATAPK